MSSLLFCAAFRLPVDASVWRSRKMLLARVLADSGGQQNWVSPSQERSCFPPTWVIGIPHILLALSAHQ